MPKYRVKDTTRKQLDVSVQYERLLTPLDLLVVLQNTITDDVARDRLQEGIDAIRAARARLSDVAFQELRK